MIRTIVHSTQPGTRDGPAKDGYLEKLVKYIPGEVVAAYTGLAIAAAAAAKSMTTTQPPGSDADPVVWPLALVFVVALVATPGYLYYSASKNPKVVTRWWAYVLAAVAFIPWSLAISAETRTLWNVNAETAEFLLALLAFVIPLFDFGLEKLNWPKPASKKPPIATPKPPLAPQKPLVPSKPTELAKTQKS